MNRPYVAGDLLQTPPSIIHWLFKSCAMCHVSPVTCQMSGVRCQVIFSGKKNILGCIFVYVPLRIHIAIISFFLAFKQLYVPLYVLPNL